MVPLQRATFLMGAEGPECVPGDREGPVREVEVGPFAIDPCAVSNSRYAAFVEATDYVTDAERYGWSRGALAGRDGPAVGIGSHRERRCGPRLRSLRRGLRRLQPSQRL